MDEQLYVRIRKDLKFFYVGEQCLVKWFGNEIAVLSKEETSIVKEATGDNTVKSIVKRCNIGRHKVLEGLARLSGLSIVRFLNQPSSCKVEIYGEKGKYYPSYVTVELTNVCNFRCMFCYRDAKGTGTFITVECVDEIVDKLRGKLEEITISGGEPTLHPQFEVIINKLSEIAKINLITNGSNIYKYQCNNVLERIATVQI